MTLLRVGFILKHRRLNENNTGIHTITGRLFGVIEMGWIVWLPRRTRRLELVRVVAVDRSGRVYSLHFVNQPIPEVLVIKAFRLYHHEGQWKIVRQEVLNIVEGGSDGLQKQREGQGEGQVTIKKGLENVTSPAPSLF